MVRQAARGAAHAFFWRILMVRKGLGLLDAAFRGNFLETYRCLAEEDEKQWLIG